ncbi:hypothetical protein DLD77_07275 [Chitinophaga alhagiae]|uniref:DUF4377 domain-containing protein n=1 Tax=Chitinophaga alhagiae TaxID=2203219 RepID=A0ABM6WC82_9BACT|nr:DUF4377 domain-containing protein [Chitinophaga alhagiae]AWO01506.1 hypothetical protein DLD77_07275 [Chitinophaga alhagiae]
MKNIRLLLLAVPLLLAACQNSRQPGAADSTQVITTAASTPEGYYEASLPAASSPGRLIALTLRAPAEVQMTTDYLNGTPEILQMGNWSVQNDGGILITLVTVGSGNPEKDTLYFQPDGESLRYEGSNYGSDGLTLVRKEQPTPAVKELLIWVKSEGECDRGPGFGKTKCYEVQYGEKPATPVAGAWEKLMEPIEGLTFEKGHIYKLRVNRIPRDPRIQDIGAYEYKLIEIMSKEKAK